jgi:hypothetical protein
VSIKKHQKSETNLVTVETEWPLDLACVTTKVSFSCRKKKNIHKEISVFSFPEIEEKTKTKTKTCIYLLIIG